MEILSVVALDVALELGVLAEEGELDGSDGAIALLPMMISASPLSLLSAL
jgi:hypothetical protein